MTPNTFISSVRKLIARSLPPRLHAFSNRTPVAVPQMSSEIGADGCDTVRRTSGRTRHIAICYLRRDATRLYHD
jgi:hypothetical protein